MYIHKFLLINNKYFTIQNNNKIYLLEDAQREYPHLNFIQHSYSRVIDDKWKDYGINHIIRMRNKQVNNYAYSLLCQ
jgi:hypothetical protein